MEVLDFYQTVGVSINRSLNNENNIRSLPFPIPDDINLKIYIPQNLLNIKQIDLNLELRLKFRTNMKLNIMKDGE
jgi:hypothetical protein